MIIQVDLNKETYCKMKIKLRNGSILYYHIIQRIDGNEMKKSKIISKALKKRFISSKYNVMKNYWVIPKTYLWEI